MTPDEQPSGISFAQRYGPWALIAGGAQGIGEAYTRHLAAQGMGVVVLDLCGEALASLGDEIRREFEVEYLGVEVDLASADMLETVTRAVADRPIGLLVYNAGLADVGPFYKPGGSIEAEQLKVAVNVTGPLALIYHFARPMLARGTGGVILMSSAAGLQGAPYFAHYAATKAYNIVLAESLWGEFKPYGVDVLACIAGMTLSTAAAGFAHLDTSSFQTPREVVAEAMAALGRQCSLVVGENNRNNRKLMATLSREEQVDVISQHAVESFFAGVEPQQELA